MKKFTELFDTLLLIDENAETRAKAKEFKQSITPVIKRVKDSAIGDPRRYAWMLVWPFMRDELNIEEIKGQDTPVNSALIQRKIEELWDQGRLPEDAGTRFEAFAKEQFDTFVNAKSITRPKNKGEFIGYDEEETASERAERVRVERELAELQQSQQTKTGFKFDTTELEDQFQNVVSDLADSLFAPSSTTMIEVFVDPNDGPIVQKQPITSLFNQEDLVGPPEIEADKFVFELKPKSQISKLVQQRGAENVEEYLQTLFSQRLDREVRVIVHAPEEGGKYHEYESDAPPTEAPEPAAQAQAEPDPYDTDSMSSFGGTAYESRQISGQLLNEGYAGGEFEVNTPQGTYMVTMRNGNVVACDGPEGAPAVNLVSLTKKIKAGQRLQDAVSTSYNTIARSRLGSHIPVTESVSQYIPANWKAGKYVKPEVILSRDRFKPTRSSQVPLY